MDSSAKILKTLKGAKTILIPLHINIDGDSIGSVLALAHLLKNWKKRVKVISADPLPENFLFLPGAKKIKEIDPAKINLAQYNLFVALDNASLSRFSRSEDFKVPPDLIVINIDHHPTNEIFGTLNYVIVQAPSTAEILYNLIKVWDLKISKKIALCLLTGIFTDTGGFQYESTTPDSMEKAATLARLGANRQTIVNHAFQSWSPAVFRLLAKAIANLKIRNRFVYSTLTFREIKNSKVKLHELYQAHSFALHLLRAVKETKVTALFYEEKEGLVHGSLRSRSGFNVAKIAKKLGGGGHVHSAAFNFKGTPKEAITKATKLIKKILK